MRPIKINAIDSEEEITGLSIDAVISGLPEEVTIPQADAVTKPAAAAADTITKAEFDAVVTAVSSIIDNLKTAGLMKSE